jgi:hypothetical protein
LYSVYKSIDGYEKARECVSTYIKLLLGMLYPRDLHAFHLLLKLKLIQLEPHGLQLLLPLPQAPPVLLSLLLDDLGKSLLGLPDGLLQASLG